MIHEERKGKKIRVLLPQGNKTNAKECRDTDGKEAVRERHRGAAGGIREMSTTHEKNPVQNVPNNWNYELLKNGNRDYRMRGQAANGE